LLRLGLVTEAETKTKGSFFINPPRYEFLDPADYYETKNGNPTGSISV